MATNVIEIIIRATDLLSPTVTGKTIPAIKNLESAAKAAGMAVAQALSVPTRGGQLLLPPPPVRLGLPPPIGLGTIPMLPPVAPLALPPPVGPRTIPLPPPISPQPRVPLTGVPPGAGFILVGGGGGSFGFGGGAVGLPPPRIPIQLPPPSAPPIPRVPPGAGFPGGSGAAFGAAGFTAATQGANQFAAATAGVTTNLDAATVAVRLFYAALTGKAIKEFVQGIVETQMALDKTMRFFEIAAGSAEGASKDFAFVRAEAERLGLPVQELAESFGKFTVAANQAGFSSKEVRDIFTGTTEALTVMNANAQDTQLVFLALEQMVSKGTVSMEELRRQLSERIPGAFNLAAKAMGVTTAKLNEMIGSGQVTARELLPKLTAEFQRVFGPQVPAAANDLQSAIARVRNSVFDLNKSVAEMGAMKAFRDVLQQVTNVLSDPNIVTNVAAITTGLANMVAVVIENQKWFLLLAAAVGAFTGNIPLAAGALALLVAQSNLFGGSAAQVQAKLETFNEAMMKAKDSAADLSKKTGIAAAELLRMKPEELQKKLQELGLDTDDTAIIFIRLQGAMRAAAQEMTRFSIGTQAKQAEESVKSLTGTLTTVFNRSEDSFNKAGISLAEILTKPIDELEEKLAHPRSQNEGLGRLTPGIIKQRDALDKAKAAAKEYAEQLVAMQKALDKALDRPGEKVDPNEEKAKILKKFIDTLEKSVISLRAHQIEVEQGSEAALRFAAALKAVDAGLIDLPLEEALTIPVEELVAKLPPAAKKLVEIMTLLSKDASRQSQLKANLDLINAFTAVQQSVLDNDESQLKILQDQNAPLEQQLALINKIAAQQQNISAGRIAAKKLELATLQQEEPKLSGDRLTENVAKQTLVTAELNKQKTIQSEIIVDQKKTSLDAIVNRSKLVTDGLTAQTITLESIHDLESRRLDLATLQAQAQGKQSLSYDELITAAAKLDNIEAEILRINIEKQRVQVETLRLQVKESGMGAGELAIAKANLDALERMAEATKTHVLEINQKLAADAVQLAEQMGGDIAENLVKGLEDGLQGGKGGILKMLDNLLISMGRQLVVLGLKEGFSALLRPAAESLLKPGEKTPSSPTELIFSTIKNLFTPTKKEEPPNQLVREQVDSTATLTTAPILTAAEQGKMAATAMNTAADRHIVAAEEWLRVLANLQVALSNNVPGGIAPVSGPGVFTQQQSPGGQPIINASALSEQIAAAISRRNELQRQAPNEENTAAIRRENTTIEALVDLRTAVIAIPDKTQSVKIVESLIRETDITGKAVSQDQPSTEAAVDQLRQVNSEIIETKEAVRLTSEKTQPIRIADVPSRVPVEVPVPVPVQVINLPVAGGSPLAAVGPGNTAPNYSSPLWENIETPAAQTYKPTGNYWSGGSAVGGADLKNVQAVKIVDAPKLDVEVANVPSGPPPNVHLGGQQNGASQIAAAIENLDDNVEGTVQAAGAYPVNNNTTNTSNTFNGVNAGSAQGALGGLGQLFGGIQGLTGQNASGGTFGKIGTGFGVLGQLAGALKGIDFGKIFGGGDSNIFGQFPAPTGVIPPFGDLTDISVVSGGLSSGGGFWDAITSWWPFAKGGLIPESVRDTPAAKAVSAPRFAFATGGEIPILATPGEYIMPVPTVQRVGVAALDKIKGYAKGGMVEGMNLSSGAISKLSGTSAGFEAPGRGRLSRGEPSGGEGVDSRPPEPIHQKLWIVDQRPGRLGPNDVVMIVRNDMEKNGTVGKGVENILKRNRNG